MDIEDIENVEIENVEIENVEIENVEIENVSPWPPWIQNWSIAHIVGPACVAVSFF